MKKSLIAVLVASAVLSAEAGGFYVSAAFPFYPSGCYYPYGGVSYSWSYPVYAYPGVPPYPYAYTRPNYAVEGAMLGAWTGGIIGASQCQGWQGAGIGAAAGLVLGTVAEAAARKHEAAPVHALTPSPPPQAVVSQRSQPAALPQRSAAPPAFNYQIPDAPRVPDAPTF